MSYKTLEQVEDEWVKSTGDMTNGEYQDALAAPDGPISLMVCDHCYSLVLGQHRAAHDAYHQMVADTVAKYNKLVEDRIMKWAMRMFMIRGQR